MLIEKIKEYTGTNDVEFNNIVSDIIGNILQGKKVNVLAGINEPNKWVQINHNGWNLTIAQFISEDVISANLTLATVLGGQLNAVDVYNASLDLYPLIKDVQDSLNNIQALDLLKRGSISDNIKKEASRKPKTKKKAPSKKKTK